MDLQNANKRMNEQVPDDGHVRLKHGVQYNIKYYQN